MRSEVVEGPTVGYRVSIAAIAVLIVAAILLVGAPLLGAILFSSDRARRVKIAEGQTDVVVEQIQRLRIKHPEIGRRPRLDRHDSYVWLHVGLWLYGWGVILAPAPNSYLAALSWSTQQALGLCLLLGSTLALTGLMLGLRVGRWRIARRVHTNVVSTVLGDDIRLPYMLGWAGLLSIAVSMWFYAITIITFAYPLGSAISAAIGCMCLTLAYRFAGQIRRYSRDREHLVAEAVAHLEDR